MRELNPNHDLPRQTKVPRRNHRPVLRVLFLWKNSFLWRSRVSRLSQTLYSIFWSEWNRNRSPPLLFPVLLNPKLSTILVSNVFRPSPETNSKRSFILSFSHQNSKRIKLNDDRFNPVTYIGLSTRIMNMRFFFWRNVVRWWQRFNILHHQYCKLKDKIPVV